MEVKYGDQWGGVRSNNWGIDEANVVCRQLGYPSAKQAWNKGYFDPGSELILPNDVECHGNETNIDQCDHDEWNLIYCDYDYGSYFYYCSAVGVTCDVVTPPPGKELFLIAR